MCDCLELFSFCSFAILDVKIFELCDKGAKFFLKIFLIGLVFNWMGMFFLRAEALGAEQPVEADASIRARQEKEASDTIEADNLGPLVYLTPQRMETLTYKIISNAESECAFDDNNEMSNRLLREIDSLMHL